MFKSVLNFTFKKETLTLLSVALLSPTGHCLASPPVPANQVPTPEETAQPVFEQHHFANQQTVTLVYPKLGSTNPNAVSYVATSQKTKEKWQQRETSTSQPNINASNNYEYSLAPFIMHYNKNLSSRQARYLSLHVYQLSQRYNVPAKLMASIVAVESSFRYDAVSSSGAIGLGQLKPDTARWLGVSNPYDPVENLTGTARYLGYLLQFFNGQLDKTIAAYYQGQGSVKRNGIAPASHHYLAKVNRTLKELGS